MHATCMTVGDTEPKHSGQLLHNCAVNAVNSCWLAHDLPFAMLNSVAKSGRYTGDVSGFGDAVIRLLRLKGDSILSTQQTNETALRKATPGHEGWS